MTQYLPPNLLALFAPREPLPYLEPLDTLPWDRKPWPYTGVSQNSKLFEHPSETPPATRGETKDERVARKRQDREERHKVSLEEKIVDWDPNQDENAQGDPFKTLFVGRINYDTSESKLRREFEQHGPIRKISLAMNKVTQKPCGYAFIVYEKERDMHTAYKHADGKKIDGKRIVVDVERGRTVKTWKPRRIGGGLGGTRRGALNENIKYSGRVDERDMNASERESHRDRNRDADHDRDRERDQERRRERSRERVVERDRGRRSRSREREKRDRPRDRDRDRGERDRDRGERERGERDNGPRERSRSRERRDRREKDKSHEKSGHEKSGHEKSSHDKERDKDKERSKDKSSRRDKEKSRDKSSRDKSSRDRDRDNKHASKRIKTEPIDEIKTEMAEDGEMMDEGVPNSSMFGGRTES